MSKEQQKAVIYARFSPRRNADTSHSCETQIDYCLKYCEFHKIEVVSIHQDKALSGKTSDDRPGVNAAIEAATKHKAILMVYSLSRLSRSVLDAMTIASKLDKAGANLCSISEKFDTSTIMGRMQFHMLAVIGEFIRSTQAQTTREAMLFHQSQGRRMSSKAALPYGWEIDPNDDARMIPNEYERTILYECKNLKANGYSYRETIKQLIEWGYEPRKVKAKQTDTEVSLPGKFDPKTIQRWMKREKISPLAPPAGFYDEPDPAKLVGPVQPTPEASCDPVA